MTRALVVLLVVGLVLAPAAVAKGPHAILTVSPEAVEPGSAWVATVELYEFRRVPRPALIARRDGRAVTATVERAASSFADAAAFEVTTVFPTAGRWRLTLVVGKRHMRFPAVNVGSGDVPQDYVSFLGPEPEAGEAGDDGVLPPEVFTAYAESDEEAALRAWWLLPVVGIVLAGAGIATFRRRGSR